MRVLVLLLLGLAGCARQEPLADAAQSGPIRIYTLADGTRCAMVYGVNYTGVALSCDWKTAK